jgi:hypothetical protein
MHLNPDAVPAILLTIPLFWVGMTLQRRTQSRVLRFLFVLVGLVFAIPGFLLVAYYTHLLDSAGWFYVFRTRHYSEISVAGLGWIAGFFYSWLDPETLGGKLLWPAVLFAFVSVPFIKPILDPIDLDSLQDQCPAGVCLQTTYSTCGPASSASLLQAFGQDASEKQLARECFTSKGGTEVWYLSRAFRRRGFTTSFVVQSPDHISLPSPSIAGVVLRGGQGHFIALLNEDAGQLTVVDPLKGKFIATRQELTARYHFSGLFLVVRRS